MIHFKPITLGAAALFDRYMQSTRNCDTSFANIFCWQSTYHTLYAETEEFLAVKYTSPEDGGTAYMLFCNDFTPGILTRAADILAEDARRHGEPLRITGLGQHAARIIKEHLGERFACAAGRDTADYIYDAGELRTLPGRRYQPKRNHLNRFHELYEYRYEPLTARHKHECLHLEAEWRRHHADDGDGMQNAEQQAIICAFDNFDALGLMGGAIYIGGRMAAFTYGTPLNGDTFDICIEKADTSFEGIFPAINRMFACSLPEQYRYIDREEDMGIEGLRRSKLSYHPVRLEYKYTALALSREEQAMRRLWIEAFGDDESFVDAFLVARRSYGVTTMLSGDGQELQGMLHLVPLRTDTGLTAAYIYGVATAPQYRRRGIASALVRRAAEYASRHFDAAILIPAGDGLKRFYGRFGFRDTDTRAVFRTEFDFGSGDAQNDRIMILPFKPFTPVSELHLCKCTATADDSTSATVQTEETA